VIYGRTLHTYCCIQGLIERGVKPENITLVVPKDNCHVEESYDLEDPDNNMKQDLPHIYPNAFEDEQIEEKIRGILLYQGVKIMQNAQVIEIIQEEQNLEAVVLKMLDMPDDEEEEDELDEMEGKSED
jgi:hypothetical protein